MASMAASWPTGLGHGGGGRRAVPPGADSEPAEGNTDPPLIPCQAPGILIRSLPVTRWYCSPYPLFPCC